MFPYLRRARNEVKKKESERHVLMLEFVRQSHLFQIISKILQDTRPLIFGNFSLQLSSDLDLCNIFKCS